MTTLILASGLTVSGPPYVMNDAVLSEIGGDKGFALDFDSASCFARQANPSNDDPLVNLANVAETRDGSIKEVADIAFSGNGIDFSGVTAPGNYVAMPNAFEAIQADTNKEWMSILTFKMPTSADWPSGARSICGAGPYGSAPDLFTVYILTITGSKNMVVRVPTATGVTTAITLAGVGDTFSGKICQLLVWRTSAGVTTCRLKALDGSVSLTSTPVTLSTNTSNLSGLTWRFGTMTSAEITNNFSASGSWNSTDIGACKWRLYRAMIASTVGLRSGVSPLTIADADLARTLARGVYS